MEIRLSPERPGILIVDDEPGICETLKDILEAHGYRTCAALTGREGLEALRQDEINLALVDLKLPDTSGLEFLDQAKRLAPEMEVVMITSYGSQEMAIGAVHRGAFSYLEKPLNIEFLLVTIRNALERQQLLAQLKEMALKDALTGTYNRRFLDETIQKEIERCQRYGHRLSICLLDIDNFHWVNTRYGHLKGDEVLRSIGGFLYQHVRTSDTVVRFGGDEFLIIMPETGSEQAARAIDRLRGQFSQWSQEHLDLDVGVTFSAGVSEWSAKESTLEPALERADQQMYQGKKERKRLAISNQPSA
ncbi:MAG: GGDEF domain-containing protein [Candidatus Bipolaricaulia bacterium]